MTGPVITVTPNPAWDVTYEVPALVPGGLHRIARVHRRLGGKGVNAARVLTTLGHDAVAVIPGPDGLDDAGAGHHGLDLRVVAGLPALRQTVVVQAGDGSTTSLWEPGHHAAPGAGQALLAHVTGLLAGSAGLIVAGSLPPGLEPALPARLAAAAVSSGVPVVVDTSGPALAAAAAVPGVVLVPNAAELAELTGAPCDDPAAAAAAARALLAPRGAGGGPCAVIVTLGPAGLAAVTGDGTWHGRLPRPLPGNPTGAGDAAAAAIVAGLAARDTWPQIVRDAVAASAAAVLSPVAGQISPDDCRKLGRQADVCEVS